MIYISPFIEKNLVDSKLPVVTLAANVKQDVISSTLASNYDVARIELFNSGANNAYYAYGRDCDASTNYNAILVPGQMLSVPVRERVSMLSVGGTTISRTVIKRVEGNAISGIQ